MWVLAAVAGHEMWTPRVIAVHQAEITSISIPLVEGAVEVPAEGTPQDASAIADPYTQPQFDLYGNQIDEAVGDYRIDPRGDLYEQHSPDTALLKLGPPGA